MVLEARARPSQSFSVLKGQARSSQSMVVSGNVGQASSKHLLFWKLESALESSRATLANHDGNHALFSPSRDVTEGTLLICTKSGRLLNPKCNHAYIVFQTCGRHSTSATFQRKAALVAGSTSDFETYAARDVVPAGRSVARVRKKWACTIGFCSHADMSTGSGHLNWLPRALPLPRRPSQ